MQELRGKLVIATMDGSGEEIMGPFEGHAKIILHGTNQKLAEIHGSNPRETPELIRGKEGVRVGPGSLMVAGVLALRGLPSTHSWVELAAMSSPGDTSIVVDARVDWKVHDEIVITPTDYDAHEAEVKRVVSTEAFGDLTIIVLDSALKHQHYAENTTFYGEKSMRMRAKVGLLTRNIVIQGGDGQGENVPYQTWNSQQDTMTGTAECGNGKCEFGETSRDCSEDCRGPAFEFGASILIASYTNEHIYCNANQECFEGTARKMAPSVDIDSVELRYYGQNALRPGIEVLNAHDCNISRVALNRGYSQAISLIGSTGIKVQDNVMFRSHLPGLRVIGGKDNVVQGNLGVVSIWWPTHRNAKMGAGNNKNKLLHQIGMYHEGPCTSDLCGHAAMEAMQHRTRPMPKIFGVTHWRNNVAAGSERSGFSGIGVACDDSPTGIFDGNEAFAALSGYWIDVNNAHRPFMLPSHRRRRKAYENGEKETGFERSCVAIYDFTAWKIRSYGVNFYVQKAHTVVIEGISLADVSVGVSISMMGQPPIDDPETDENRGYKVQSAKISSSLIVGRSNNGRSCGRKKRPGLVLMSDCVDACAAAAAAWLYRMLACAARRTMLT